MTQDIERVAHILTAIEKIENMTNVSYEQFSSSIEKQDAVVYNFLIIGEAASRLSDSIRNDYPDIPWRVIIGMRNVLIHDYMQTNYELIWSCVKNDLPILKTALLDIQKIL